MRVELEKKRLMGVKVVEGEASSMAEVESQSVDAVIVAQVRPLTSTTRLRQTARGPDALILRAVCRHFIGRAEKAFLLLSHVVAADHPRFANKDALEEIYRVLSPGGAFGMIWVNSSDTQSFCLKDAMLNP